MIANSCDTSPLKTVPYLFTEKVTALVVSSSCQVSHVLPIVNGRLDASNCKRLVTPQ